jgi:hypothetical protein
MTDRYGYCKVFVSAPDPPTVRRLLATLWSEPFDDDTAFVAGLVIEVRRNPDAVPDAVPDADGFLHWPVLVEVEAGPLADRGTTVDTVAGILTTLWDSGHRAVAACDYEDELPWAGGIRRLRGAP